MILLTYDLGYENITWHSFSEWHRVGDAEDVGIKFTVINFGNKTIKYCIVSCAPINRVGDYVACSITNEVGKQFKMVGPIEPDASGEYTFEKAWYNKTIHDVKDIKVSVLYMDGSSESLTWEQIEQNVQTAMPRLQRIQEEQQSAKIVSTIKKIITIMLIIAAIAVLRSCGLW